MKKVLFAAMFVLGTLSFSACDNAGTTATDENETVIDRDTVASEVEVEETVVETDTSTNTREVEVDSTNR